VTQDVIFVEDEYFFHNSFSGKNQSENEFWYECDGLNRYQTEFINIFFGDKNTSRNSEVELLKLNEKDMDLISGNYEKMVQLKLIRALKIM
jgi:hypothetical protein